MIDTNTISTSAISTEYLKLSVSERIQLVEDIRDSIAAEASETIELSQAQKMNCIAAWPSIALIRQQPFRGNR